MQGIGRRWPGHRGFDRRRRTARRNRGGAAQLSAPPMEERGLSSPCWWHHPREGEGYACELLPPGQPSCLSQPAAPDPAWGVVRGGRGFSSAKLLLWPRAAWDLSRHHCGETRPYINSARRCRQNGTSASSREAGRGICKIYSIQMASINKTGCTCPNVRTRRLFTILSFYLLVWMWEHLSPSGHRSHSSTIHEWSLLGTRWNVMWRVSKLKVPRRCWRRSMVPVKLMESRRCRSSLLVGSVAGRGGRSAVENGTAELQNQSQWFRQPPWELATRVFIF
jgi:hypothetical protein